MFSVYYTGYFHSFTKYSWIIYLSGTTLVKMYIAVTSLALSSLSDSLWIDSFK